MHGDNSLESREGSLSILKHADAPNNSVRLRLFVASMRKFPSHRVVLKWPHQVIELAPVLALPTTGVQTVVVRYLWLIV